MCMVVRRRVGGNKSLTGLRKGPVETENCTSRHGAFSLMDCCPNKGSGSWDSSYKWSPERLRPDAHCLNQRILYTEKQGQEPNKTKPEWSCCIPCRNLHYKHLASKMASVLDNRKRKLLLSVSLCYRQELSLFNCHRDPVKQICI